ncbi:hypothetical protein C8Q80DRAFT_1272218 [Daedaleopsis nitida]|nr:hypothetical protein C8Q80DRAFT_1272218 [Daedaleopsis nitida]
MSTTGSDSEWAELIAEQESLYASLAYMSYDWFLNIDDEFNLFWRQRASAASILYFCIRYPLIIYWIMGYPTFNIQGVSCEAYMYTILVLQLLIYVFPAVFSALRVYALTGQNKLLAAIVLFFGLGPLYANSVHYGWEKPAYVGPDFGCVIVDNATHEMGVIVARVYLRDALVTGVSRGMLSVSDLLVIIITWTKTSYVAKHVQGLTNKPSLSKTLLQSGIVYFVPLAFLNILHTILTEVGAQQFLRHSSLVSVFIDPVTSVLACRFLLNLRRVEVGHHASSSSTASAFSTTVRFEPQQSQSHTQTLPPFISSLGELIETDYDSDISSRAGSRGETDASTVRGDEMPLSDLSGERVIAPV